MKKESKDDESFDVFKTDKTIRLNEDGGVLKEILKEGLGGSPHRGCACDVHYVGRLSDGTSNRHLKITQYTHTHTHILQVLFLTRPDKEKNRFVSFLVRKT